ncbi:MAG TPA: PDDEXK nuclease domain-containing protein [Methanocorpusculum sp.]|nr:PDDEXK nuclease domain-containing protein [Methanocorpusculum sp.]
MPEFSFDVLVGSIREVDSRCLSSAVKAVNVSLTLRNWCVGAYIKEFELHRADRAGYGERLYERISSELKQSGVRRCDRRELLRYVLFYERYPGVGEVLPEAIKTQFLSICSPETNQQNILIGGIWESLTPKFSVTPEKLVSSLSFSHISEILQIDDPLKRAFYEVECIRGVWSVRELKRQIDSMYFERSGLSKDKKKLAELAEISAEKLTPALVIRDPYVFEFLGLKPAEVMDESCFESALLDKLKEFLLELGHGFCFEARQKKMLIGDEYYFADLVFYHRILKCHVLVDLKMEGLSHAHVGQINMYLNWFKRNEMCEGDNPPVGLLLCPRKDEMVVEYATGGLSNEVFVSKYEVVLPSVEELEKFVEHEVKVLREMDVEYKRSERK